MRDIGIDILTALDYYNDKVFDSKWTPIVLSALIAVCAGAIVGIELVRAVS